MTVCPALRRVLLGAALLAGVAGAQPPRPLPQPPKPETVGFAQVQRVLNAARRITAALEAGPVLTDPGPGPAGPRTVILSADGQAVARVALRPDGTLAALPGGPARPGGRPVTLAAAEAARLKAVVASLTVSGAVQVTPADYRVPLLSGGVVVAVLRLDRVTLDPRPDGPPPGPRDR
ncbi:hypothetical protein HNQ07_000195 [Deinococcus metalli]|uniref:Uncharacterized protein n=1 Tax=Deinococcus metalli TaxID=1141878 RepID=A0A7W8NMJ1_9DEIO|nr:hypothetical protein [Deinococcus metalli]MBB5374751.1 hypothetical protein [Deinococcus metalli]GHF33977.1 hypothetical protein GCM10017781_08480 [Deinococcus metalli]